MRKSATGGLRNLKSNNVFGPIGIVDYGCGNLHSVLSAFEFLGAEAEFITAPEDFEQFESFILPGVGSFKYAMDQLYQRQLAEPLITSVQSQNKKLLGICLGFQLLAKSSSEAGYSEGLCLIDACVERFNHEKRKELKVPHVGFNEVHCNSKDIFFEGVEKNADFYFCHSYRMTKLRNETDFVATSYYGHEFISAYRSKNIFGAQFHPEKSQTNGLRVLLNFLRA